MRKMQLLYLVAFFAILLATPAFAAFDNSHHDLRGYISGQTEGCFHCHGRISASAVVGSDNIGAIGALCLARCHTGTGIVTTNTGLVPQVPPTVSSADYSAVASSADYTSVMFNRSHGRSTANVQNNSGASAWAPNATALAYPYIANAVIECTTCHSVHNSANAPFIWNPLAPTVAGAATGFCEQCHVERATRLAVGGTPNGMHPVNVAINATVAAAQIITGSTIGTRHAREIYVQGYGAAQASRVFDVATPAATAMSGLPSVPTQWNTGGHVFGAQNAPTTTWTGGASTQILGCNTCHAAHRTNIGGEAQLLAVPTFGGGGVSGTWNPICMGCHGAGTTVAVDNTANDGGDVGTTAYGHPVGANTANDGSVTDGMYTSSNGTIKFLVHNEPAVNPRHTTSNVWGNNGRVLCLTCHTVHYGQAGTMALANLSQVSGTIICKRCHNGVGIPDVLDKSKGGGDSLVNSNAPNTHHVTRSTALSLNNNNPAFGAAANDLLYISAPSWRNTTSGVGDIAVNMDCADCHLFNATAHNW